MARAFSFSLISPVRFIFDIPACVSLYQTSARRRRVIPGIYTANITTEPDDDDRAKLQFRLLLLRRLFCRRNKSARTSGKKRFRLCTVLHRLAWMEASKAFFFFFMIMKSFRVKNTSIISMEVQLMPEGLFDDNQPGTKNFLVFFCDFLIGMCTWKRGF